MLSFGERLKLARKEKKLTQKQLALLINAKHNSISNWENNQNKPDPDTIEQICGALDISPNWLLGYPEIEKAPSTDTVAEAIKLYVSQKLGREASPDEIALVDATADAIIQQIKKSK